jgi:hypothetical protein
VFEENSCLYHLLTRENLLTRRNRLGDRPLMFEIPSIEAWDIDEELDFTVAETLVCAALWCAFSLRRLRCLNTGDKSMKTVLVSAPYMLPEIERFRPVLEAFDLALDHARLSMNGFLRVRSWRFAGAFDGTICGDDRYTREVIEACTPRLRGDFEMGDRDRFD